MALWVLKTSESYGWDEVDLFVVRASTEQQARKVAAVRPGCESQDRWLDPSRSTCERVPVNGDSEIIARQFNAG